MRFPRAMRVAPHAGASPVLGGTFIPEVDVIERAGAIVVRAEIPGVALDDLEIAIVGDELELRGEKRLEPLAAGDDQRQAERSHGHFVRHVPLHGPVDATGVALRLERGVLEVVCPLAAATHVPVEGHGAGDTERQAPPGEVPTEWR